MPSSGARVIDQGSGPRCAVAGRRRPSWIIAVSAVTLLQLVSACTGGDGSASSGSGGGASAGSRPDDAPEETQIELVGEIDVDVAAPDRCEHFFSDCMTPFPSNRFTVDDPSTETGLRLEIARESMPANTDGVHVDPAEWNRSDGFSPGALIVVPANGVDPANSGIAGSDDIGASLAQDSPILLIDAETGEQWPYWAELDSPSHLELADAGTDRQSLLIRPARNLTEGHRYIVALRGFQDTEGRPLDPPPAFEAFRDRLDTAIPEVEQRRRAMEEIFETLATEGVDRDELYLAWDFTVASTNNVTGRAVHMRDEAFGDLGDGAPEFEVVEVVTDGLPEGVHSVVTGSVDVPNFLTDGGAPGSVLNNGADPDGIPVRDGEYAANFLCVIPEAGLSEPAQPLLYGHGLLGSVDEVEGAGKRLAPVGPNIICGTDWIGMATRDVGPILGALQDLSDFRIIPDRLQQAMLNMMFLGRAMIHPDGFASHEAFQGPDGDPVMTDDLAYVGLSQGGIMGGATSALALDWDRVFLGVPGMNYSTLLNRSVDFDTYAVVLRERYTDPIQQQILFSLIQMLWDRGENNGYASHLTADPLPGSEPKRVLVYAVFGDHQVANVATDVMARTMGLAIREPGLEGGRSSDAEAFWGIETVAGFPHEGSAYVMWDFGTGAPPVDNVPNRAGEDPHGMGRSDPDVLEMVTTFLRDGVLIDVCGADKACTG